MNLPVSAKLTTYLNPDAFSKPVPDTYGTAPRTLNYRTPGFRNMHLALLKRVRLAEGKVLEFRLEAFDLTNASIFDGPNATAFSPSFGVINSTANSPRELQAAVKFRF